MAITGFFFVLQANLLNTLRAQGFSILTFRLSKLPECSKRQLVACTWAEHLRWSEFDWQEIWPLRMLTIAISKYLTIKTMLRPRPISPHSALALDFEAFSKRRWLLRMKWEVSEVDISRSAYKCPIPKMMYWNSPISGYFFHVNAGRKAYPIWWPPQNTPSRFLCLSFLMLTLWLNRISLTYIEMCMLNCNNTLCLYFPKLAIIHLQLFSGLLLCKFTRYTLKSTRDLLKGQMHSNEWMQSEDIPWLVVQRSTILCTP